MVKPPPDEAILTFPTTSAIDSCAVSNLLCSRRLVSAASRRNRHFVLAEYVRYECLVRRRSRPTSADAEAMGRLKGELDAKKNFSTMALDVNELREVARLREIKRLGHGELASMVLARRLRLGLMTEDAGARRLVERASPDIPVRTTSHLVGWLVWEGELSDGDIGPIKDDNLSLRGENGWIGKYIQACHEHAQMLRLMHRSASPGDSAAP